MMGKGNSLGEFEQLILLALMRIGSNAYGMTIRRELAERIEREVSIGAIYTTLERLERKGFVTSLIGEPTKERGGRAKRYFRICAPGHKALEESWNNVHRMRDGMHNGEIQTSFTGG